MIILRKSIWQLYAGRSFVQRSYVTHIQLMHRAYILEEELPMPPIDQKCVQDLCKRERYKFLIVFCAHALRMRIMQQDLFNNHKNELIKSIIKFMFVS